MKFDIWKPAPKPKEERSYPSSGYNLQTIIVVVALLAAYFAFSNRDKPGPGPGPGPGPEPSGEVTHVLAIDGSPAVVKSTKVGSFCSENGIEYRSLASGNRPEASEKEILKLYDAGIDKAPRVMFMYKNGSITDSPLPASADELVIYIEGASE